MQITGIEIQNFRGIRNLSLSDLDRHTNLFVGKNGAGKSSLLDAISNVMSWFVARMLSNTGRGKDIPVNDISLHAKEGSTIRLQLDRGEWCTLYRSTEMKKNGKSDLATLNVLIKEFREKIYENPQTSVPVFVHYGVGRVVADIPLRIKKNPKQDVTNAYVEALDSSASFRDFFAWFREQEDLENEIQHDHRQQLVEKVHVKLAGEFADELRNAALRQVADDAVAPHVAGAAVVKDDVQWHRDDDRRQRDLRADGHRAEHGGKALLTC